MVTRKCTICKEIKTVDNFYKANNKPGYHSNCKGCIKVSRKKYYACNKDKINAKKKLYNSKNREKMSAVKLRYEKRRCAEDPLYLAVRRLRKAVREGVKRGKGTKTTRTENILGMGYKDLKTYLEATYYNRYGKEVLDWSLVHIDHIVPMSEAVSSEHATRLNHYTNLQLLDPKDNLKKGTKTCWE